MAKQSAALDRIFSALSDSTRRAVVRRLALGPASVSELAAPFDMALPSFLQHLRVLEEAGVVRSRKAGRVRTCELCSKQLARAQNWVAEQRELWETRGDRLAQYLEELESARKATDD